MKKLIQLKAIIVLTALIGCSNDQSPKKKEIQEQKEVFKAEQVEKETLVLEKPKNGIDENSFEYSDWMNGDGQNGEFILTDEDLNSILNSPETIDSQAIVIFDSAMTILNADIVESERIPGLKLLIRAAKLGNLNAAVVIADCLTMGWAFKRDVKKSFTLLVYADSRNYATGSSLLGHFYLKQKQPRTAIRYMKHAANSGNPDYQYDLGEFLLTGWSPLLGHHALKFPSIIDIDKGFEQLTLAANNGQLFAQQNLGLYYFRGTFVPKNDSLARVYLNMALDNPDFDELRGNDIITDNIENAVGVNWKSWLNE